MPSPFDQHRYQVRLEWGARGLARLAPADIVVIVDVLGLSTRVTDALDAAPSDATPAGQPDSLSTDQRAADIVRVAADSGAVVLLGCLRNASATARAVMDEQTRRADRTSIAVIAVGEETGDGELLFSVEDLLGAGAVIDGLTKLGIDHTSPEAAVAAEGFHGLRRATRHLLTASGSGQALLDAGEREVVLGAAAVDVASVVPTFVDGVFVAT